MLLSSCVVWRHLDVRGLPPRVPGRRRAAPAPRLRRARRGARVARLARGRGRVGGDAEPAHDRQALRAAEPDDALVRAAGDVRFGHGLGSVPGTWPKEPLVLATGGFAARYARERGLLARCNPWSEGDGLDFARAHGAETAGDLDEFYGRAMPAPPARVQETRLRATLAALGRRGARRRRRRPRVLPRPARLARERPRAGTRQAARRDRVVRRLRRAPRRPTRRRRAARPAGRSSRRTASSACT